MYYCILRVYQIDTKLVRINDNSFKSTYHDISVVENDAFKVSTKDTTMLRLLIKCYIHAFTLTKLTQHDT